MDPRTGRSDLTQSAGRGAIRRPPNLPWRRDPSGRAALGVRYAASRRRNSASRGGRQDELDAIGLAVVALVAAVAAVYALFQALDERSAPPIVIEDAAANLPVVVDVRGEVEAPGVFDALPGSPAPGRDRGRGTLVQCLKECEDNSNRRDQGDDTRSASSSR